MRLVNRWSFSTDVALRCACVIVSMYNDSLIQWYFLEYRVQEPEITRISRTLAGLSKIRMRKFLRA